MDDQHFLPCGCKAGPIPFETKSARAKRAKRYDLLLERDKHAQRFGMTLKTWRTAGGRTRDSHTFMNGRQVKTYEKFRVGNGALYLPSEPLKKGQAGYNETWNCRCWVDYSYDMSDRCNQLSQSIIDMWKRNKDGFARLDQANKKIIAASKELSKEFDIDLAILFGSALASLTADIITASSQPILSGISTANNIINTIIQIKQLNASLPAKFQNRITGPLLQIELAHSSLKLTQEKLKALWAEFNDTPCKAIPLENIPRKLVFNS